MEYIIIDKTNHIRFTTLSLTIFIHYPDLICTYLPNYLSFITISTSEKDVKAIL